MIPLVPPNIPSSNIVGLNYDITTNVGTLAFKSGDAYEYYYPPIDEYNQILNGAMIDPKDGQPSVGHTAWALGWANRKNPKYSYKKIVSKDADIAAMAGQVGAAGKVLSDIVNPPSYIPFGSTGTPLSQPTTPPIPVFPLPNIVQPPVTQPKPDINNPQNPIA